MEFLIISGMSGAGKSQAADILEDMDYYCVDNMPLALLPRFAELCIASRGRYDRVALVTDVRERESVDGLLPALDGLWEMGLEYRILFMEDGVIVEDGSPAQIFEHPKSERLREFLGKVLH